MPGGLCIKLWQGHSELLIKQPTGMSGYKFVRAKPSSNCIAYGGIAIILTVLWYVNKDHQYDVQDRML